MCAIFIIIDAVGMLPGMEKTLAVLNQMEKDGVISRYVIGGAIAASFYVESTQTFDLDIFLIFPESTSGLISISPIYAYLMERGYRPEGEAVNIEGWPVQFLPAFNPLLEEALENAVDTLYNSTPTRIFTAEYLAAVMLFTGRPKDQIRLAQFVDSKLIKQAAFEKIISQHALTDKWNNFKRKFVDQNN